MRTFRFVLATVLAAAGLSVVVAPPAAYAAASVGTFDQCERGTPITSCSGWTGGNLTSGYTEDMVVPQRVELQVTSAGTYTFTTTYDDLNGSGHVIDYLATWNYTQTTANPCTPTYAASLCSGTPSTFPMASDGASRGPVVAGYDNTVASHELPQADRRWTLYGGTITGVSPISHASGTGTASVTFTTTGPGTAILLFGAHLSLTGPSSNARAWPAGASTVNGNAQLAASIGGNKTHNIKVGSATPPPPPAAFTIEKSANTTTANAGGQVQYTVTVRNTGGTAGSTTFTDDYDNNVTGVSTPAGCVQGSGAMTCTTNSIAAGGQQVFTYTATMPATFTGGVDTGGCTGGRYPVVNTATLANTTNASTTICVSAAAAFTVTKTADVANPAPGQLVEYTITVKNEGNATGSTSFVDDFDDRLTPSTATSTPAGNNCAPAAGQFSCTTGSLAPNATQTFVYSATMPTTFAGGTACPGGFTVSNSVTLTGASPVVRDVCVQTTPGFVVTKAVDDDTVEPGDTVEYTVTVTNNGSGPGSTTVTDDYDDRLSPSVPAGCTDDGDVLTCTTGSIVPGGTQSFVYTAAMPTQFSGSNGTCATGSYPVANTATVGTSSASRTVCVAASPSFSIAKSVDDESGTPSQTVTYTIVVTNTGTAAGATAFTDDYPAGVTASVPTSDDGSCAQGAGEFTCSTDTLASGASATFTYSATLPATYGATPGGGGCVGTYPVVNTVSLDDASGSDSATVCVTASPAFTVEKSVDEENPAPGATVTYSVVVSNTGTAAGSTSFTDDYDDRLSPSDPSGCTDDGDVLECTTDVIPAGQSETFTYTAVVPSTFSGQSGTDPCAPGEYRIGNVVVDTDASADLCVAAAPDFTIAKVADTEVTTPGATINYTVTVTNNGTAAGSTSFVDDYDDRLSPTLPGGCTDDGDELTCATDQIPAGDSQTFEYSATLPSSFGGDPGTGCEPGQYAVANTASISPAALDSVTVCVDASAQFAATKSVDDTTAEPGQTVEYTITVTNNGNAAGSTGFSDDYDDRTPPTGAVTGSLGGTCTDEDGTLVCTTGTIPAGESETFVYQAVIPETFGTDDGTQGCETGSFAIRNSVTLDEGPGASALTCVAASPEFTVAKVADKTDAAPGDTVTYTITVSNGGTAAGSTSFIDDFDNRLEPSTAASDPSGADCEPDAGAFQCTTGVIPAGGSQSFTYSATLPATYSGESGVAPCDVGEYGVANSVTLANTATTMATICVAAAPAFVITKAVDDASAVPGQTVTYTVTVANTGTAAGSTSFVDDYDERLTPSIPTGCIDILGTLSCTTGEIAAGDSESFVYTADLPTTFSGDSGGGDCAEDAYRISNEVTSVDAASTDQDVCVEASPAFTVAKTVDDSAADPGQTVTYTVTVTNGGTAAGSTTFVDDYDGRLDPSVPDGCVKSTDDTTLTCTTGPIAAGEEQVFTYSATLPETFSGESGVAPCAPGQYSIANAVTIDGETVASRTVCVTAAPAYTITKSADDTTGEPGQTITYTVVVANEGSVAGSTTFVDDHDDRVTPSVPDGCEAGDGILTCTTGVIEPGGSRTFTYTVVLPDTYSGGTNGCEPGSFGITNIATLANGGEATGATVCVAAEPEVSITKSVDLDVQENGDQVLTYTIEYENTGAAEAQDVILTDPVPAGTGFVSCSADCTLSGTPATATWDIGTIAPRTGSGAVTLVVKVTSNQTCSISNTAQITVGDGPAISSNTTDTPVSPAPDPSTAKSNGSAVGVSLRTSGLLDLVGPLVGYTFTNNNTLTISSAQSSRTGPGAPAIGHQSLLSARIPGNGTLVNAGVLTTASASTVSAAPAEARQTTVSEVAGLCLIKVAGVCTVSADVVRAVASTMANGSYASISTAGSTITNLRVVNTVVPVDLNTTVTIPLNPGIFGKNSYVAINERTGSAGLKGGRYVADQSVAMIHVKITGALGVQAVEAYVGQATAHSEFARTFVCTFASNQSVSGHAYTAKLFTGPLLADLLLGYTQISPLGGDESAHILDVRIPRYGVIANAKVADNRSIGTFTNNSSDARSWAEIVGDGTKPACVLSYVTDCVAKATLIRSEARSTAGPNGSITTDAGTRLVDLSVLGIPIAATPEPNTVIALPGIGFVILNEQFCDNGSYASGSCSGPMHSGMTVRALRVVVTVANNLLGLDPGVELIVAEAHADSTFS